MKRMTNYPGFFLLLLLEWMDWKEKGFQGIKAGRLVQVPAYYNAGIQMQHAGDENN